MNKTLINQTVYNLIATNVVLVCIVICKAIVEQDINIDYFYAMASVNVAIMLFEFLLKRK